MKVPLFRAGWSSDPVHRGACRSPGRADLVYWYREEERHLIDAKSVGPEVLPTLDGLRGLAAPAPVSEEAVYFALVAVITTILGDEPGLGKTLVALVASQADPSRSREC